MRFSFILTWQRHAAAADRSCMGEYGCQKSFKPPQPIIASKSLRPNKSQNEVRDLCRLVIPLVPHTKKRSQQTTLSSDLILMHTTSFFNTLTVYFLYSTCWDLGLGCLISAPRAGYWSLLGTSTGPLVWTRPTAWSAGREPDSSLPCSFLAFSFIETIFYTHTMNHCLVTAWFPEAQPIKLVLFIPQTHLRFLRSLTQPPVTSGERSKQTSAS